MVDSIVLRTVWRKAIAFGQYGCYRLEIGRLTLSTISTLRPLSAKPSRSRRFDGGRCLTTKLVYHWGGVSPIFPQMTIRLAKMQRPQQHRSARSAAFGLVKILARFRNIEWIECPGWYQKTLPGRRPLVLIVASVRSGDAFIPHAEQCVMRIVAMRRRKTIAEGKLDLGNTCIGDVRRAVDDLSVECKKALSHPDFGKC